MDENTRMIMIPKTITLKLIFALIPLLLLSSASHTQNCFSVIVGKDASSDGSVLFAHNEDTGIKLVNTYKVPARRNPAGTRIQLENGAYLDEVEKTYGYLWINMPGIAVCDTYLNEQGLAVGSDGCPSKEDQPELHDGGIVFWVRRAVAERASTAREAVKLAAELIEHYGYASSGRTYIFADAQEAWLMAVVNGKQWVAQRVPDDEVAVIPNYYTIGYINLSDKTNFMGSPDIVDYAIERGWYDPDTDGEFHFARAYTAKGSLNHPSNIKRRWIGLTRISGQDIKLDAEFLFSIKPEKPVSLEDLMSILRDHYEGTEHDKSQGYTLGSPYKMNGSMIGAGDTQYGAIAQLRSDQPKETASVLWLAHYRPDGQTFTPWYASITETPAVYRQEDHNWAIQHQYNPPESIFDRTNTHAYWTFIELAEYINEDYTTRINQIRTTWERIDHKNLRVQKKFESAVHKVLDRNPDKAIAILNQYSNKQAIKVHKKAKRLLR